MKAPWVDSHQWQFCGEELTEFTNLTSRNYVNPSLPKFITEAIQFIGYSGRVEEAKKIVDKYYKFWGLWAPRTVLKEKNGLVWLGVWNLHLSRKIVLNGVVS